MEFPDGTFELTKVQIRVPPSPFAGGSFRMWRLIFIIRIILCTAHDASTDIFQI